MPVQSRHFFMKTIYWVPILLISFLVVGFFFLSDEIFMDHKCNLKETVCEISNGDFKISVELGPREVRSTEPFQLLLNSNQKIEIVKGYLIGLSFQHEPTEILFKESGENFISQDSFPICTENKMLWRYHLVILSEGTTYKTNFDVEVFK